MARFRSGGLGGGFVSGWRGAEGSGSLFTQASSSLQTVSGLQAG